MHAGAGVQSCSEVRKLKPQVPGMSKAIWKLATRKLSLAVGWTDAWKGRAGCQLNHVGSRASMESEPCVNCQHGHCLRPSPMLQLLHCIENLACLLGRCCCCCRAAAGQLPLLFAWLCHHYHFLSVLLLMFLCFTSSTCTTDSRQGMTTQPKSFIEPNATASDMAAQESLSADSLPVDIAWREVFGAITAICLDQSQLCLLVPKTGPLLEHQEFLFLAKMEMTAGSPRASFRLG